MKYFFAFLLFTVLDNDLNKIAKTNQLKKEAEEYFKQGKFEQAAEHYKILIDSFDIDDDAIRLNLAHALYELKDTTAAVDQYKAVAAGTDKALKSSAYNQLGVIAGSKDLNQQALGFFKQALRENPANENARFNYELTKKKLKDQPEDQEQNQNQNKQEQQNQDKEEQQNSQKDKEQEQQNDQNQENKQENQEEKQQDQENQQQEQNQQNQEEQNQQNEQQQDSQQQDQESQENKEQSQQEQDGSENKEEQEAQESKEQTGDEESQEQQTQPVPQSIEEKLQEMNLTPEKARMILEAMKNSEIQYIQQNKRKAMKKRDSNKPDW